MLLTASLFSSVSISLALFFGRSHAATTTTSSTATCTDNKCARAVTVPDSSYDSLQRRYDCSSFFGSTTYDPTYTTTQTTYIFDDTSKIPGPSTTTIIYTAPPRIPPPYATAACNKKQYSSVCNCWGVGTYTVDQVPATVSVGITECYYTDPNCKGCVDGDNNFRRCANRFCPSNYDLNNCGGCGKKCPSNSIQCRYDTCHPISQFKCPVSINDPAYNASNTGCAPGTDYCLDAEGGQNYCVTNAAFRRGHACQPNQRPFCKTTADCRNNPKLGLAPGAFCNYSECTFGVCVDELSLNTANTQ